MLVHQAYRFELDPTDKVDAGDVPLRGLEVAIADSAGA